MNDIDGKIVNAVCDDFKYGLLSIVNDVNDYVADLKETVKYERYFDLASGRNIDFMRLPKVCYKC